MPTELLAHWSLDPAVRYLNHGSYGACPTAVLTVQSALRAELEREPVAFLSTQLPGRLALARAALGAFLGADPDDLAFVPNATSGVNTVLRSLPFEPGDELLVTTHTYAACRKTADDLARTRGIRVVVAELPFPVASEAELIAPILASAGPRTRLALLDHVTSPTALVLPLVPLVQSLAARGIDTLVDGAHAPGMVPVALDAIGAAYYTGNAHKWLCAPKGAAFLHVRRDRQAAIHPLVTSHGAGQGYRAEFDWTGTQDPTAWLSIPAALETIGGLVPGGWPAVMARNHALALAARDALCRRLGVAPPAPDSLLGSMASVPLPRAEPGSVAATRDTDALGEWCRERGVRTWLYPHPRPLVRASAQLYTSIEDFEVLASLLAEALRVR
ncbi:MAG: aminotransferase class V-fold PLP-dependent enzyme [Proteobacteria bacterium]|nr:aminotransferase class V-fold PLP-dependent enzyme [Pseudomonadota bacterium]